MEIECPNCKQKAPDTATACPSCGTAFATPPDPGAPYYRPPQAGSSGAPADRKDKTVAGILGILLGGLGIHAFYIGNTKMGIILLLTGLIVGIVTCGIGFGIPGTIGIIQGILYLVASEQDFHDKYVVRQQWF